MRRQGLGNAGATTPIRVDMIGGTLPWNWWHTSCSQATSPYGTYKTKFQLQHPRSPTCGAYRRPLIFLVSRVPIIARPGGTLRYPSHSNDDRQFITRLPRIRAGPRSHLRISMQAGPRARCMSFSYIKDAVPRSADSIFHVLPSAHHC